MSRLALLAGAAAAACGLVAAAVARAELPPPTPAEKAKLDQKAAAEAAQTKREERETAKVQEQVARLWRKQHGESAALPQQAQAQPLDKSAVPKAGKHPPGVPGQPHTGPGPNPAEAHSSS